MAKGIREYLNFLENEHQGEILHVEGEVNPAGFDVTALLTRLEKQSNYPLTLFSKCLNLKGEISRFPLVTNIYASRKRCALAMGLGQDQVGNSLGLEYALREAGRKTPVELSKQEAPVKQVIKMGDEVDLSEFPIVRHHYMDGGPYIDMTPVMRDPDTGAYNIAFLRTMYKGPRKLGLHMSPRHNWQIVRKNEEAGKGTPVVIVVSHHPAFYLGALNVSPFGVDDYELTGSIMNEPLRVTASETWGDSFMVPADADILIEGEVLPNVREVEGPFGEFPGTFGPQRLRWVIDVKAITYRKDAVYQDIFVGHKDNWVLGAIPKEGTLYNRIKGVVPTVKGIHLPDSGTGRFNCYISINKKVNGESKQAAFIAMGECDFVKNVVVVDADVDPFNEQEVMWAVATRVQADNDVDIIKNVKGNTLEPSQTDDIMTTKMIIDATKPLGRPFAERVRVPEEALARVKVENLVSQQELAKLTGGKINGQDV
ncbi:MAG: Phenolic acid decarboxylase subunit C [Pelotomaculum sp. PtaB.Bin104]|nr:MAG: Phenolic acid decarboxylase subunit C [Pelotomaculum sp. PtaB.Bin104]